MNLYFFIRMFDSHYVPLAEASNWPVWSIDKPGVVTISMMPFDFSGSSIQDLKPITWFRLLKDPRAMYVDCQIK